MAEIVGCVNLSHSPFWNIRSPASEQEPGGHFDVAVGRLREMIRTLRPDTVVVFGTDHARGLFYDLMPPFTIGVSRVQGVGDYDTPANDLATNPELARAIFDGVTQRGFDPAISLSLRIDHGVAQVYQKLFPKLDMPLIPIIVNSGAPPLPTFERSWAFGKAVGETLRSAAMGARILVVGSGGMSHWPNSTSALDPNITEEWRDFLINGRERMLELEEFRRQKAISIAADEALGHVNDEWDRILLDRMKQDPTVLQRLDAEDVEEVAGPGALELRTWAAATAAWGGALTYTDYEPVPQWITGMGISASQMPAQTPHEGTKAA